LLLCLSLVLVNLICRFGAVEKKTSGANHSNQADLFGIHNSQVCVCGAIFVYERKCIITVFKSYRCWSIIVFGIRLWVDNDLKFYEMYAGTAII